MGSVQVIRSGNETTPPLAKGQRREGSEYTDDKVLAKGQHKESSEFIDA